MALDDNISALATAIGAEIKDVRADMALISGGGSSDYLSLNNIPFSISNPDAYSTIISPRLVGQASPDDSSSGEWYMLPSMRTLNDHGGSYLRMGHNSTGIFANGNTNVGVLVSYFGTRINQYIFPSKTYDSANNGKVLGLTDVSTGQLDWVTPGGGGTQNVFIQEAEPTIDVGTSALWIQKSLDGSITFNLIEN